METASYDDDDDKSYLGLLRRIGNAVNIRERN